MLLIIEFMIKMKKLKNVKNFKPIGYSISKHAIIGITKYIATYWAHKNIRCNTLVPGAVFNNQPSSLIKNVKKRVPLNRWAKKNEYKKALQFLAVLFNVLIKIFNISF